LKILFWRQIVPNINNFDDYLDDDQKIFFNFDENLLEIADGTLGDSIICNETKSNKREFMLCHSTVEYLKAAETFERVERSFKNPTQCQGVFGFESDDDDDPYDESREACVKIKRDKPPVEPAVDVIEQNLLATFNAFLRNPNESNLNPDEVHERLANPNVLSSLTDIHQLPPGVQGFLQQMKFFKDTIIPEPNEKENENPLYSLDIIHQMPSTSNRMFSERNKVAASTSEPLASSTPVLKNSTYGNAGRETRSQSQNSQNQVPNFPTIQRNARMDAWAKDFGKKKKLRARLSSPLSSSGSSSDN
jgi:hypothetical protein